MINYGIEPGYILINVEGQKLDFFDTEGDAIAAAKKLADITADDERPFISYVVQGTRIKGSFGEQ